MFTLFSIDIYIHIAYSVVRLVNGEVLQKYKHPAPVFGCDWSPTNKWVQSAKLATGPVSEASIFSVGLVDLAST